MKYNKEEIIEKIQEADMILIGLGEEFDEKKFLKQIPEYEENLDKIKKLDKEFLIPLLDSYYLKKYGEKLKKAYEKIASLITDKNYFIVSTGMNEMVYECGLFKADKIVTPCGGYRNIQCINGCKDSLILFTNEKKSEFIACCDGKISWEDFNLDRCPKCGNELVFNNIYLENYLEEGYLSNWDRYMKWTQGTLNKKLLILELGVGLLVPSVIRWPFEKIAFFNQKSTFYRIHETLYQMTEELQNKGNSIAQNAVDFFAE